VSRSLLMRMLENFFRRWYLYLVPVLLLALVGAFSVAGAKKQFQSVGTFNVESSTVLSTLSGSTGDPSLGYDTPATATSKRIGSLLQTDQFVKDIASKAKLDTALTAGQITVSEIRSSIGAAPNGANLVNLTATNIDPAVAQALAGATIAAYVQSIIDSQASQSNAAIAFFTDLVTTYQTDLATARRSLSDYLTAHPAPVVGARSDEEQAELARINGDVTQAQTRYDDALTKKQGAELTTEQTKADVGERLRIVDAPVLPSVPLGGMKKTITSMATFVILGIMLAAGAVVVGTLLDHSVRTSSDVSRLGLRLLTVVPDTGGKPRKVKARKTERKPKQPRPLGEPKERTRSAGPRVARSAPRKAAPAAARKAARPATKAAGGSTWPG
jgi:uncharacterized protein involved in exopolysaccharide biosynthesis